LGVSGNAPNLAIAGHANIFSGWFFSGWHPKPACMGLLGGVCGSRQSAPLVPPKDSASWEGHRSSDGSLSPRRGLFLQTHTTSPQGKNVACRARRGIMRRKLPYLHLRRRMGIDSQALPRKHLHGLQSITRRKDDAGNDDADAKRPSPLF
jgi:hypothetical protein